MTTIIAMPATPVPAQIDWSLKQPSQVNRSMFTGARKVTILPGAPRWTAKVTMPPVMTEAAMLPWRAWITRMQGSANAARLNAGEKVQLTGVAPEINGAAQTGLTLVTDGWGPAGTKLKAGQFVTINDQLLVLTADVVADGSGAATIAFLPYIRVSPADNDPITVDRPTALMAMAQDDNGWSVGRGQQYAISFSMEEAF